MATLSFDVPEAAARAVCESCQSAEEFALALRLAAAMFWYSRGEVTMGTAAQIAGLDLRGFLTALSDAKQEIFLTDAQEVSADLAALAAHRGRDLTGA